MAGIHGQPTTRKSGCKLVATKPETAVWSRYWTDNHQATRPWNKPKNKEADLSWFHVRWSTGLFAFWLHWSRRRKPVPDKGSWGMEFAAHVSVGGEKYININTVHWLKAVSTVFRRSYEYTNDWTSVHILNLNHRYYNFRRIWYRISQLLSSVSQWESICTCSLYVLLKQETQRRWWSFCIWLTGLYVTHIWNFTARDRRLPAHFWRKFEIGRRQLVARLVHEVY